MNRSPAAPRRRPHRLPLALLLASTGAFAQSANCDKLRQTLSARIESGGVHGYGLDILPAKESTPAGGKVIGTCDGGAYKAVYRRFASSGGSSTPAPTTAPAPMVVAAGPPPAPAPAPGPAPSPPPPPPPPPPASPAPQPAPTPPPPAPAPAPPPVVAPVIITAVNPVLVAASGADTTATPPATLTLASASSDPLTLPAVRAAVTDAPPLATGAAAPGWRWLWALLLLPLAGWLWSWVQHRRQYDAAGLPRGPRL